MPGGHVKAKKPTWGALVDADDPRKCIWFLPLDGKIKTYATKIEPEACDCCGERVICALPPPLLAQQPDDTTHVCNPALGGCNHGFAKS